MTNSAKPITELSLNKNMNDMAHSLVRELSMACKKMAIYAAGHPLSAKALDKPLVMLGGIFRFKRFVNLNVQKGCLYVLNIRMKDTVFSAQIIQHLQLLDVSAVRFDRAMTGKEFSVFVENLVRRENRGDPGFNLATCLQQHSVSNVQVNTEAAVDQFERGKQYRGELGGDLSVRRLVLDQLGNDLLQLARVFVSSRKNLLPFGIDFDSDLVKYLIPERVAAFTAEEFRAVLSELVEQINLNNEDEKAQQGPVSDYLALFRLVQYHPEHDRIVENLEDRVGSKAADSEGDDPASATGAIRIESQNRMDTLLADIFASGKSQSRVGDFTDAYHRLLTTGQRGRAAEVALRILDSLGSPDSDHRQKALELLVAMLDVLNVDTDDAVISLTVRGVVDHINEQRETYEYSEFIWGLFDKCLRAGRYDYLGQITSAMAARRRQEDDVTVYDSMAVKKAFQNINQPSVINRLVTELIQSRHDQASELKNLLVAIGSEEVALALATVISHPSRGVRQQALKILAELGKASLKVFTRILEDDSYFSRDVDRHELPDAKWYVVRNSVFVLGSLGDPQGVPPLRLRLSDSDVRVRREIISALEKIGGEDAIDCLILMAEDSDREIRECAVIAIGLTGGADAAPLLIDVVGRIQNEALKVVTALGKLGGKEARAFLCSLLEDDRQFSELAAGKVSKEDLRVAVVKALGQIGDQKAIEKIQEFRERQSGAQKIFFKNSPVNKAITEVLSRQ